jgi:hypothetical protein
MFDNYFRKKRLKSFYTRKNLIKKILTEDVFPEAPHIEDGKMSWIRDSHENRIPIDIFFNSLPLAVQIHGPERREWNSAKFFVDHEAWEEIYKNDLILKKELEDRNIPLLIVGENDPFDAITLREKSKETFIETSVRS